MTHSGNRLWQNHSEMDAVRQNPVWLTCKPLQRMCNNRMQHITTIRSSLLMFPLTPDQHHWLDVATEDEGWCSFSIYLSSTSFFKIAAVQNANFHLPFVSHVHKHMILHHDQWGSNDAVIIASSWSLMDEIRQQVADLWRKTILNMAAIHHLDFNKFSFLVMRLTLGWKPAMYSVLNFVKTG